MRGQYLSIKERHLANGRSPDGPIVGVAIDQGFGLEQSIADARGARARDGDLATFKKKVVAHLSPSASMVLVDATMGRELVSDCSNRCHIIMGFEDNLYDFTAEDRITRLPKGITIPEIAQLGINSLKLFMYYAPRGNRQVNRKKQEIVKSVGQQCLEQELLFMFEPLVYDDIVSDTMSAEFAALKPVLVRQAVETFSGPSYHVDLLKVEIPINIRFVEGYSADLVPVYDLDQALEHYRQTAAATDHPFLYLSAGVSFEEFCQSLEMANRAGITYDGFMCGRAIWSDAIGVFGRAGEEGLDHWLRTEGTRRVSRLSEIAQNAGLPKTSIA